MTVGNMKHNELVEGETYLGEVDRISNSGNGLISTENTYIRIGGMEPKYVGELVCFGFLGHFKGELIGKASKTP